MNIIETLKNQIAKQTRSKLNTNVYNARYVGVPPVKGSLGLDSESDILPIWVKGVYNLQRHTSGSSLVEGVTPTEFKNYSGTIKWEEVQARSILFDSLSAYDNIFTGIKFFCDSPTQVPIHIAHTGGIVQIFTKEDGATSFTLQQTLTGEGSTTLNISLGAKIYTSIVITFYALSSAAQLAFTTDNIDVLSWEKIDIEAPAVPTWTSTPVVYRQTEDNSLNGKNVLSWYKDTDTGGNNIYRSTFSDTGLTVGASLPATVIRTYAGSQTEHLRWFDIPNNSTLNSGDVVRFGTSTATYQITKELITQPNLVPEPIFNTTTGYWTVSPFFQLKTANAKVGKNYYGASYYLSSSGLEVAITSTMVSINPASLYYVGFEHSSDLMLSIPYNLEGYKANPSRWAYTNLTGITSTFDSESILIVNRNSTTGTFYSTDSLPLSANSTYSLIVFPSFQNFDWYQIQIIKSDDSVSYSSPSLYSANGYQPQEIEFKPTNSGYHRIQYCIHGTVGSSSGTVSFKESQLYRQNNNSFHEYFTVNFYDGSKAACSPATKWFKVSYLEANFRRDMYTLGSLQSFTSNEIPSDCEYVKVGFLRRFSNSVAPIFHYIYSFFLLESLENSQFSYFGTIKNLYRISGTNITTGTSIELQKDELLFTRERQPDDAAIITWSDYDIEPRTYYEYKLDAFDNSFFKNKSGKTIPATLTSGDMVSPKTPTNYELEGTSGGIIHYWTNPTANDLAYIRFYSTSTCENDDLLFQVAAGGTSLKNRYSENVSEATLHYRWTMAVDSWGNQSGTAMATCRSVAASLVNIPFNIVVKSSASGDYVYENANGWYNENIVASIAVEPNTPAIASYLVSNMDVTNGDDYTSWAEFDGTYTHSVEEARQYKFKLRTSSGDYSQTKELRIRLDKSAPEFSDKHSFWNSSSGGYPEYNSLKWDNSQISDNFSGIDKLNIYRVDGRLLNKNPILTYAKDSNSLTHWEFEGTNSSIGFNTSEAYYDIYSAKYTASGANSGTLSSSSFTLSATSSIICYCRAKSNLSNATITVSLNNLSNSVSSESLRLTSSATWKYIETTYNTPAGNYRLDIKVKSSDGSGSVYLDEMIAFKKDSVTRLEELNYETTQYNDTKVEPWKHYLYYIQAEDYADNTSVKSPYKYARTEEDLRDKYRNMLDNSSFERVFTKPGGTLVAEGWVGAHEVHYGNTEDALPGFLYNVHHDPNNAQHGSNYVSINRYISVGCFYGPKPIVILPYVGRERNFIMSAYLKKSGSMSGNVQYYIYARDNEKTEVRSKQYDIAVSGLSSTEWTRVTTTFSVTTPSITELTPYIYNNLSGGSLLIDAVQFEEKAGTEPTDYYDTKSITADYLQGNLIRGHIIEADTLYGDHIQSDSIQARHIRANEITATQIKSNTITANELNLVNARLWIRDKDDMQIVLSNEVSYPATLGYCCLAPHGSVVGLSYAYAWLYEYNGDLSVYAGLLEPTLEYFSTNFYNYQYIRAKNPLFISGNYNNQIHHLLVTGTTDSSKFYIARNTGGLNTSSPSWDTPTITEVSSITSHSLSQISGRLNYYAPATALFGQIKGATSPDYGYYNIWKVKTDGSVSLMNSIYTPAGPLSDGDFDQHPTSPDSLRILLSSATSTLYYSKWNLGGSQVGSWIEIPTHGGFSQRQTVWGAYKPHVTACALSSTDDSDRLILLYRLYRNQYTYYKIIDSSGNIKLGGDADVVLMHNRVHENYPSGHNQLTPRLMKAPDGDVLAYLAAATIRLIPYSIAGTQTRCVGGKGVYLAKTSATLNLEDLFNRIS